MSYLDLGSLLHGPVVHVLNDENLDGRFNLIACDRPLAMLTYFSSTIRQQIPINHSYLQPQQGQHWTSTSTHMPQPAAVSVRLIGGSSSPIIDLIEWMTACCRQNTLLPLRSVIECPVRYIFAVDGIKKLGVDLLANELPVLLARLRYEIFDVDTVGRVFASGNSVPPEILDAICHCLARYFFHGSLPEVDQWMYLARVNAKLDHGVSRWLAPGVLNEGPDTIGAWELWQAKTPISYPSRWREVSWVGLNPSVGCSGSGERHYDEPARPRSTSLPPAAYYARHSDGVSGHCRIRTPAPVPVSTPPPPPPKPEAYRTWQPHHRAYDFEPEAHQHHYPRYEPLHHQRPPSPKPEYTVHCSYCQAVFPQPSACTHQYSAGHACTVSDSPSPTPTFVPPRRRSRSVSRGRSPSPYERHGRRQSLNTHVDWDPAYEPPRPGEYLRGRRQIGPRHFLHHFVDEYGRERTVNKRDDLAMERSW
ncbi:uncharacterized protein HMPREF1541_02194 [Cyphellophora europaea CBS 101466]|uniref:Uncharacterized protein n=1 Tax=Cyphellophora europaea (strain CBS 101466) TaxID=1220924 RepID=W2S2U3_CYPE1|nr:uncharacterized protein HMPREF1541_02194 [Cyphellophora europaea CBS 101466]ETN43036.1 hypothetical protein HMPREF1541_02194 [Cyphellophora europaea CBS 101466]